jgi:hypothetical protein
MGWSYWADVHLVSGTNCVPIWLCLWSATKLENRGTHVELPPRSSNPLLERNWTWSCSYETVIQLGNSARKDDNNFSSFSYWKQRPRSSSRCFNAYLGQKYLWKGPILPNVIVAALPLNMYRCFSKNTQYVTISSQCQLHPFCTSEYGRSGFINY